MPRSAESEKLDPSVQVLSGRLDWAVKRSAHSQEALAARVSRRLGGRKKQRAGRDLPASVTAVAIHHWRTGNRASCRLSVLTVLADELGVPVDFLRGDRAQDSLPLIVKLPGDGEARIDVNWHGWIGRRDASGETTGTWAAPGSDKGSLSQPRMLAGAWTDLNWWRHVLFEDYDPEDALDDDSEVGFGNPPVAFFEHMAAALEILLAPMEQEGKLKPGIEWELLGLQNPALRRLRSSRDSQL